MKAVGTLEYEVEDVFHIFIKNIKKDFLDFNEENPTGSKIKKNIQSTGTKPIECTVQITDYIKNQKYQITTSTSFSKCVSTYMFKGQKDGTTKLIFEEKQDTNQFFSLITLYVQRFMARRSFKTKYNYIVEGLNNELKAYFSSIERSKPKNKVVSD